MAYALAVRISLERAAEALRLEQSDAAFDEEIVMLSNVMRDLGFTWEYGELYVYRGEQGMAAVMSAIDRMSRIDWIAESIEDVHAFRLTDEADLTGIVSRRAGGM
ncbi:hypothetical protein [Acuticoccus mangrovi]|uniref:Uncharacterized protein n=1 Tax=Acuticoccus mangrovi TaxID=2796142 RepID=A0A934MDE1_9HYPH|nr:hypothetical protein [Acuticoccus mangrovi]MBJ3776247.1 hypothetical protein [Acuticoccus mangrovi]